MTIHVDIGEAETRFSEPVRMMIRQVSRMLLACLVVIGASVSIAQDKSAPSVSAVIGAALARPAQAARLHGNPGDWFGDDAYPPAAIRADEQGRVAAKLDVDVTGMPVKCTIETSSGSQSLDAATCAILNARARFDPARDDHGKAIASSYTQSVRWMLPDDAPDVTIGYQDAELTVTGTGSAMSCTMTIEGQANPLPPATCADIAHRRPAGENAAVPMMLTVPATMRPPPS